MWPALSHNPLLCIIYVVVVDARLPPPTPPRSQHILRISILLLWPALSNNPSSVLYHLLRVVDAGLPPPSYTTLLTTCISMWHMLCPPTRRSVLYHIIHCHILPHCRTLQHYCILSNTVVHTAALPHTAALSHTAALPDSHTLLLYALPHTATNCRTLPPAQLHCHTRTDALPHTSAHCRTAAHALPRCRTLSPLLAQIYMRGL